MTTWGPTSRGPNLTWAQPDVGPNLRQLELVRDDREARALLTLSPLPPQFGQQQLGVHRADELPQRLGARGDDLGRPVDLDPAGQAVEQDPHLLRDQRLQRLEI